MKPIEIIGGGLAGLSLGLALSRAGVPVTLSEAGGYPRHRVCGEFITGLSAATIGRLGLEEILGDALLHHEVAWFIGGSLVCTQRLPAPARALSRYTLDGRLAAALVAAGGQLRTQTRAPAPDLRPGLVCTTGRRRSGSAWLGLKIHARNLSLERDLELHLGHGAYIGLTKVEGERVNLCGLFPRRELSARGPELIIAHLRAANLDGLADRLAGADFDHESFSAVAAVGFDRHFPPAAGLALGDAAAMIPPFTGNGMAMAFESAAHALGPLVLYCHGSLDWPTAAQTIQAALRRHFRLRLAAAGLLHPFLLQAPHQRWLTRLARAHLLPFRPLYSVLH